LRSARRQAADLPVKAKAVEYVRICSAYGAGFWYIPGTDTCMKIGGYFAPDVTFNAASMGSRPGPATWPAEIAIAITSWIALAWR